MINTSVYLIVSKHFYTAFSSSFFGGLSNEEVEEYCHLNYLNRIFSSKSYWRRFSIVLGYLKIS